MGTHAESLPVDVPEASRDCFSSTAPICDLTYLVYRRRRSYNTDWDIPLCSSNFRKTMSVDLSSLHTCQSTFLLSHPCRRPARQRTARVRSSRREGGSLRRSPTWRVGGYRVLVDLMQHRCHWKTVTRQAHVLCGGCVRPRRLGREVSG